MNIKVIASGSKGNCYLIDDGETKILIECGIPFKQIQIGCDFKLSSVSACLVSHEHLDHCKAVPELTKAGIDVYAPREVFEARKLTGSHRTYLAIPHRAFSVGTFSIYPFDCQHDVPNNGYLIESRATGERLFFATDTYYIKYRAKNIQYYLIECNYSLEAFGESIDKGYIPASLKKRLLTSHMSLEHFIQMLQANDLSRVKQIYLLHLSDNNSNAELFKKTVQKVSGAEVYIA